MSEGPTLQGPIAPAGPHVGAVSALLVTRVGRRSLHDAWLHGPRAFDVVLSSYDPQLPQVTAPGVHVEYRPGFKIAGYGAFLADRAALWRQYDLICLMDEDLLTDTDTLNRMFALCRSHNLKLAQPALTPDSHFTYAALVRQPRWLLRHVTQIEMMCPVFRRDVLDRVAPLFTLGYESGIDLVWCNLVAEGPRDFAVLDSCPVRHTAPVGARKAENGFDGSRVYEDDIAACLARFGLPWLSCVPYEAIDLRGRRTRSRLRFLLAACGLWRAIPAQRPRAYRIKAVLDHLRHIVTRPARNIRVDGP